MDTEKLRGYCDSCLPEQWRALEGADRSKVISGNALVVQGHWMDVNAIVAFANAMPELLDAIERLQKERDEYKRLQQKYYDLGHNRTCMYYEARKQRDAALAEVERLK